MGDGDCDEGHQSTFPSSSLFPHLPSYRHMPTAPPASPFVVRTTQPEPCGVAGSVGAGLVIPGPLGCSPAAWHQLDADDESYMAVQPVRVTQTPHHPQPRPLQAVLRAQSQRAWNQGWPTARADDRAV